MFFDILLLLLIMFIYFKSIFMNNLELIHFSNRTSFGDLTHSYLNDFKDLTREEVIEKSLSNNLREALVPEWFGKFYGKGEINQMRLGTKELVFYWVEEMRMTKSPLLELMTYFWHNHFATSIKKVKQPSLVLQQNLSIRNHCIGKFGDLLRDICVDPAMGIFLDFGDNKKGALNENFARELLELYTMGEGNLYTEKDIQEIARAFTGIKALRRRMKVKFVKKHTDYGEKNIFGVNKNFTYSDVIDLILKQDETAFFISQKLWDFFISIPASESEKMKAFRVFENSGLEIKPLLMYILTSDKFWSKENVFSKVKSPLELLVSSLRTMMIKFDAKQVFRVLKSLEHCPFFPPSVKGWEDDWLDTQSIVFRDSLLKRVYRKSRNKEEIYIPKEYKDKKSFVVSNDFQLK